MDSLPELWTQFNSLMREYKTSHTKRPITKHHITEHHINKRPITKHPITTSKHPNH